LNGASVYDRRTAADRDSPRSPEASREHPPRQVTAAGNAALAREMRRDGRAAMLPGDPLLAGAGGNASLARLLLRREDTELEAQEIMRSISAQADDLIRRHRGDHDALARAVLRATGDWDGVQVGYHVLEQIGAGLPGLVAAIARQTDESALRSAIGTTQQFLMAVTRRLRSVGNVAEAERFARILVSPEHAHLLGESASASPAVQGALGPHGASLQSAARGAGPVVYDEYWIVMDAMPPRLTPEQYLAEMSTDLNHAVHSSVFDDINVFQRTQQDQRRGAPAVGDVYDIDIRGPDNGSVMLVESTPNHFIFQTVTTSQTGEHPENGSREFGFQPQPDGSVRFYTRGVSRPGSEIAGIVGAPIQRRGWTAMLTGIGATLQSRGGRMRSGSFGHWIKRG
jgi:hypothetical protein